MKLIKPFFYTIFNGVDRKESGFNKYKDGRIVVLDIPSVIEPSESFFILPDSTINTIRVNGPTNSKYLSLIIKYLRTDKVVTLDDISLDLNDELISLDGIRLIIQQVYLKKFWSIMIILHIWQIILEDVSSYTSTLIITMMVKHLSA